MKTLSLSHLFDTSSKYIDNRHSFTKRLWLLLVVLLLTASCDNGISDSKKITVGIINPNPALEIIVEGFKDSLVQLCKHKGREIGFIQPKPIKLKDIAYAVQKMQEKEVDLIFTVTTPATLKAKETLNNSIPIVFAPIYDPIRSGVVDDLRNKTDNITGVKIGGSNAKTLEWLIEAFPNTKNILVPFSGKSKVEYFSYADLKEAADKLGLSLTVANITNERELKQVLNDIDKDINALWLIHSIFMLPKAKLFVESAVKHQIPFASGTGLLDAGIMIAYGQRHYKTGAQAGRLAHQIIEGVSSRDLPIETADFYLHLDLDSTSKANLKMPDEIIRHAEHLVRTEE